jgi:hypothetical protein
VLLLHAAMSSARRYFAWVPHLRLADVEIRVYDGLPHNICDSVPDRCAAEVRDFLRRRFGEG